MVERVIIVVLDGVGAGELPDAADYGDAGSDTIVHVAGAIGGITLPNFGRLGMGHIRPIAGVPPDPEPIGSWGRMREESPGKDSVTGHWEMMGVVLEKPFPTYPLGFPSDVIQSFESAIGTKTLGNYPASGTEIIEQLGAEHQRSGYPIIYTSADSVFQIAAHEAVIPVWRLYELCAVARRLLVGDNAVARVIARPFVGDPGNFRRTEGRKDFSMNPPPTDLDALVQSGRKVHAIGKISEFFNGHGITTWDHTTNNADHSAALLRAVRTNDGALIFANFEDFDMLYGHRNDAKGFARALEELDSSLPTLLNALKPSDLLIFTNDHGNDPTTPSTDHSREHACLLTHGPGLKGGVDLGVRCSFADLGATVLDVFDLKAARGESFLGELTSKS